MSEKLKQIVNETAGKEGTLIIPSFAVERAQLLMYMIWQLQRKHLIPHSMPVVLDSPMGTDALSVFRKHHEWHKLSEEDIKAMTERVVIVQSMKETWEIIDNPLPKIIIAGSGMVGGGHVLSYLKRYITKQETTVLLAGYQAEGTRGRQLLEGADEIKFFGKYYPVKARIEILDGISAHADRDELVDWVSKIRNPKKVFLTHGEPNALDTLRVKLKDLFGWEVEIPDLCEIKEIAI